MIFFAISIISVLVVYVATRDTIAASVVGILNLIGSYLLLPTISWGFYDLLVAALVSAIVGAAITSIESDHSYDSEKTKWSKVGSVIFISTTVILILFVSISSSAVFHADDYRELIGKVHDGTFSTETAPIDIEQIRVVDQKLAQRLGEKRLGEDPALGSKVELGEMNIQKINGELYWAGPLNHTGLFKWLKNSSGTSGYILVSAINPQNTRLVRKLNNEDIKLRYNFGALFGDDPKRHIYNSGYASTGLTDFTFEVDDNLRPYIVATSIEKTINFGGTNATGVVVLDMQTGEVKDYSTKDAPAWIDRIQPENLVTKQLNWWGDYVEGWWNPSDNNKLQTSTGASLVYGSDEQVYWYTGLTSVGADESTVGFVLVNTRTKEVRRYKQAGATELAAMESAEGAVQEKGYEATFPILYNIGGRPTYFMTLKDDAGLVKSMAFVSVENYQVVGLGSTVRNAYRAYRRNLLKGSNDLAPDTAIDLLVSSGVLERKVMTSNEDGSSQYYLMISSSDSMAFVGSTSIGPEIILSQPGDSVEISYESGGNMVADIITFDNLKLHLKKTPEQARVEEQSSEVQQRLRTEQDAQNADARWEDMSAEEKAEYLKKLKQEN